MMKVIQPHKMVREIFEEVGGESVAQLVDAFAERHDVLLRDVWLYLNGEYPHCKTKVHEALEREFGVNKEFFAKPFYNIDL